MLTSIRNRAVGELQTGLQVSSSEHLIGVIIFGIDMLDDYNEWKI